MFWWISGAVVVVLIALAWWSSGPRRPGMLGRKGVSQDGVDIGRSGAQARHNTQFGPTDTSGSSF